MAIEDIIAGAGRLIPQFESLYDAQQRYMSLRDLMDQRRYRDLQERRLQMQIDEARRQQEEKEQFRRGLKTLPKDATLQQTIDILGPDEGFKFWTNQQTARTQQRQAEEAATKATEAGTARRKALAQQMADIGMEAVKIKDPAQREEFFNTQLAGTLIDRGFTPAQEFGGFPVPKDERAAQFAYGSAYGAEKLRDFLNKQAKAEQERIMNPLQLAEQRAKTARAQQELTGQALPSPSAAPALFHTWYGGWLLRNNKPDTPENRSLGIEEYNRQTHPQFATPGVDVPYSPAVLAQKKELAVASQENKPLSDQTMKQIDALKNYGDALAAYEAELEATGPVWGMWDPAKAARLSAAYEKFTMAQKEADNLGALQGADLGLLRRQAADPTDLLSQRLGKEGLKSQLGVAKDAFGRHKRNFAETHNLDLTKTFPERSQPAGAGAASKPGIPKVGDVLPNGKRITKVTEIK